MKKINDYLIECKIHGLVAELLHLKEIRVPFLHELVGHEEIASIGERRVDEIVEPNLGLGREKVELVVEDQVAVVVRIKEAACVLVHDAKHEEDLRVCQISSLVVRVRQVAVLQLELEILEHVLALEELVTPVGRRLELRVMEHDEHAAHAQAQKHQKQHHTRSHDKLGQLLAHDEVVEQTGRHDHVVEELFESRGHFRVHFAPVGLDVFLVRDHKRGYHGNHHTKVDQYANAREYALR